MLRKSPGFSTVVVFVLALGIGANTAIFTLVNAVLFRALPFKNGEQIVLVESQDVKKAREHLQVSFPDFRDWRMQAKSFGSLAAWAPMSANLADRTSTPERYSAARMTSNAFSLIGQAPQLGRDFTPADEKPGAPSVAIIGNKIWKDRYGGRADVIGQTVRINEVPATIIGVMPPDFRFPVREDLWLAASPQPDWEQRSNRFLFVFGRLGNSVSVAAATAEMDLIAHRLENEYSKTNQGMGVNIQTFNDRFNGGKVRVVFLALLGAVGFVLLIACANVANLLLARSISRTREVSIRIALGAGRWRIVRQLLIESILLGFLGGTFGLGLALAGVRAFDMAVANVGKPYWIRFTMDPHVFAYMAAICVLTGIVFGVVPALHTTKVDVNERLKEGGRNSSRGAQTRYLASAFVVAEVALSIILMAGAGLLLRSLIQIYSIQSGTTDAASILSMRLSLVKEKYPDNDARWRFYERLMPKLASIPGVESVTIASQAPLSGYGEWPLEIEGQPVEKARRPNTGSLEVEPSYFATLGVPLLSGRRFELQDGLAGHEVAMVNLSFAAKYWNKQDPLGRRIRMFREDDKPGPWLTIVGIVPDVRQNEPTEANPITLVYVPLRQNPIGFGTVLARTSVPPSSLAGSFRQALASVDADMPAFGVMPLSEVFATQRWPFRVFGTIFVIFSIFALTLAVVGIYAVIAYSVNQRIPEIGVRVALGAGTWRIVRMVLAQGAAQLGIGLCIGLAGAVGLTRVLKALLVQVSPTDPLTFAAVSLLLITAGALACMVPARRAANIDPVKALRYE